MNKYVKIFISLFCLFALIDLVAVSFDFHMAEKLSKPFIIPSLIGYFLYTTSVIKSRTKTLTIVALILCGMGDILLLAADYSQLFFLAGLSSFLLGHLFYIYTFYTILKEEELDIRPSRSITLFVIIYVIIFFYILLPKVELTLLGPIMLYGLTIGSMMVFASSLKLAFQAKDFATIILGAALFIISDSLIAVNKFINPLPLGHLLIMITYISAQFLIIRSIVKYLNINHTN